MKRRSILTEARQNLTAPSENLDVPLSKIPKKGTEVSDIQNNISSVAQATDRPTIIKCENTKPLLLPTIRLTRLNSEHYIRSFDNQNRCPGVVNGQRIVKMEASPLKTKKIGKSAIPFGDTRVVIMSERENDKINKKAVLKPDKKLSWNNRIPQNGTSHQSTTPHQTADDRLDAMSFIASDEDEPFLEDDKFVSKDEHHLNGLLVQDKEHSIKLKLSSKDINDASIIIQELGEMKESINNCMPLLAETAQVCEQFSVKQATPKMVSAFGNILKHRWVLHPMAYTFSILTLSHCGKFQEAFEKLSEMIETRTFPPQEDLVDFVNDMLKYLRANPKWIIALIQSIKKLNLATRTDVLNNCLFSLAAAPVEALCEVALCMWDQLIAMVCHPPNVQAAMQVQNIMYKNHIPMSDQNTTKLLLLFRDTKSTKQLLDLAHLKHTSVKFDISPLFADDSLNLCDVEAHIVDLVKTDSLPREDILHLFIEKAVSMKEFNLIYKVFLQCHSSPVRLSVKTMKKMLKALEDWDENVDAAIEVYTALRLANTAVKTEKKSTAERFPSFQLAPFVVPLFTPVVPNYAPPLRIPLAPRCSQPNLVRHQFHNQLQAKSVHSTPRFGTQYPAQSSPPTQLLKRLPPLRL